MSNIAFIMGLVAVLITCIAHTEVCIRKEQARINELLRNHAEAIRKLMPPKQ
jgi:hypothetical protein